MYFPLWSKQTKPSAVWFFFSPQGAMSSGGLATVWFMGKEEPRVLGREGCVNLGSPLSGIQPGSLWPPQMNVALSKHQKSWLSFQLGIVPATIPSKSICAAPGPLFDHSAPSVLWRPAPFFCCSHLPGTVSGHCGIWTVYFEEVAYLGRYEVIYKYSPSPSNQCLT